MEQSIVSLEALGTDWARIIRFVERSGQPLWIEADGEIHGVLLPTDQARRLLGTYAMQRGTNAAAQIVANFPRQPEDANDDPVAGPQADQPPVKKII